MLNLAYNYQDGVASECMRLYLDENTDGIWAELEFKCTVWGLYY